MPPTEKFHLNGFNPEEAKKLGVDHLVRQRIETARRVVEAVNEFYPDQAAKVASLFDLDMQLTRFFAAEGAPVREGFMVELSRTLHREAMKVRGMYRVHGNFEDGEREALLRGVYENPDQLPHLFRAQMIEGAKVRIPGVEYYDASRDRRTPDMMYQKYGIDVRGPQPKAGLYIPFTPSLKGFDVSYPEAGEGISGVVGYLGQDTRYAHLVHEASDMYEHRFRGTRYFQTPILPDSMDGHLVVNALPMDIDYSYGIQFDDERLLAALATGVIAEPQAGLTGVPRINGSIYYGIGQLDQQQRAEMVQSL